MAKKVFAISMFAFLVLAIGQVPIKQAVLGAHFVNGVKKGGIWCGTQLVQSKVFAQLSHPKFLDSWFPLGEHGRSMVPEVEAPPAVPKKLKEKKEENSIKAKAPLVQKEIEVDIKNLSARNREYELQPMTTSDKAAVLRILE